MFKLWTFILFSFYFRSIWNAKVKKKKKKKNLLLFSPFCRLCTWIPWSVGYKEEEDTTLQVAKIHKFPLRLARALSIFWGKRRSPLGGNPAQEWRVSAADGAAGTTTTTTGGWARSSSTSSSGTPTASSPSARPPPPPPPPPPRRSPPRPTRRSRTATTTRHPGFPRSLASARLGSHLLSLFLFFSFLSFFFLLLLKKKLGSVRVASSCELAYFHLNTFREKCVVFVLAISLYFFYLIRHSEFSFKQMDGALVQEFSQWIKFLLTTIASVNCSTALAQSLYTVVILRIFLCSAVEFFALPAICFNFQE